jgi:hypothetical protein
MKTNYILVDFENVQPSTIKVPSDIPVKVLVFLGERQTKVSIDLAMALQSLGEGAEYVKIDGTGKNALDFHIAYWIGKLSEKDPNSYFHIVSKDKGFDPLIKHLRKNKRFAQRVAMVSDIQILSGLANGSTSDRIESVASSLKARGSSRPRKRKTLRNTISAFFMKTLKEDEIDDLIVSLEKKGYISFSDDLVTYNLEKVENNRSTSGEHGSVTRADL